MYNTTQRLRANDDTFHFGGVAIILSIVAIVIFVRGGWLGPFTWVLVAGFVAIILWMGKYQFRAAKETRAILAWRKSIIRESVVPGVYEHFKGNIYHVIGVAENTETHELTVVYIPQMGPHRGKLSNRPAWMFCEEVRDHPEKPRYQGPRFRLIEKFDFIIRARDYHHLKAGRLVDKIA